MRAIEICYINEDDRIGHARGSRGKALGTECELANADLNIQASAKREKQKGLQSYSGVLAAYCDDAGVLAGCLGWTLFSPLSSFFVSHALT